MERANISRRNFLGLAAGAVGSAALGGLTACGGAQQDTGQGSDQAAAAAGTTAQSSVDTENLEHLVSSESAPQVFFTTAITPAGLQAVYDALGFKASGKVAVKVSTGEGNSNYLRPELVGDFVRGLSGAIVECNTAYGGDRSSTERHRQLAEEHGFTQFAEVDIMDADGSYSIPVNSGVHLPEDLVGASFPNYDTWVSLAHFKGHAMGGFGGAVKNCSIGIASSEGKCLIHNAGEYGSLNWWTDQDSFLESMAEAAKAVADQLPGRIVYVNVMNRISIDCDCDPHPAEPDMADVGILASTDPVALDQACVDLVYAAPDGASVVKRIENKHGIRTLEHAQDIGLGSRSYRLVQVEA